MCIPKCNWASWYFEIAHASNAALWFTCWIKVNEKWISNRLTIWSIFTIFVAVFVIAAPNSKTRKHSLSVWKIIVKNLQDESACCMGWKNLPNVTIHLKFRLPNIHTIIPFTFVFVYIVQSFDERRPLLRANRIEHFWLSLLLILRHTVIQRNTEWKKMKKKSYENTS